jgi:hypothetical protein
LFYPNLNLLTVESISKFTSKAEYIEKEMDKIKDEYAPLVYYSPTNERSDNTLFNLMNNSLFALSREQVDV